jgi:3-hydroxyisobutyrate dehydrogenase-like beta-hydroxyacid dehydrogenase
MTIETVGILSPGDMGHAIGATLARTGLRCLAALDERSERTRRLSASAGIEDVGSLENLVEHVDLILCVLVPSAARDAAGRVADAMRARGKGLVYADCNAIAPATTQAIGAVIAAAGGEFIDAGIIGGPPRPQSRTRLYASGPTAGRLEPLTGSGLEIRVIGDRIGQASGLKMCYAALTKGLTAIGTELLLAAHRLDLQEALWQEFSGSQKALAEGFARSIPSMTSKAHRWVGEMEEIAATFGALGLTPRIFEGAAALYQAVAETDLGKAPPEQADRSRDLWETIAALSRDAGE